MESKYDIGDKVIIIPNLSPKDYDKYCLRPDMARLLGGTVTIKGIHHSPSYGYFYDIEESRWQWLESLFDGLENEIKVPFDENEYDNLMNF